MSKYDSKAVAGWSLLIGVVFIAASCAIDPVSGKRELMLISEADEIKIGQNTDIQVKQEYGLYDDQELLNYMDHIYQQMVKLSHRPGLPYRLSILDTSVVNAFAVPGGYVYMTRGILACLNSEAELAGVLGHELGHITARHSAEQMSRAQLAQLGLGVGMILSETLRGYGGLAQFGVSMFFLKFSRDNEREADNLGVEYSSKAGYNATQMAKFFGTLEMMSSGSHQSGLPDWFSTHPNPVDRRGAVIRDAKKWQSELGNGQFEINRNRYLKHIDGLVFGEDPRQGYVEEDTFFHPVLQFQFPVPSNWQLQNTQTVVIMISDKKDAYILFSVASASSPKKAAENFVFENKAKIAQSDETQVNGLPAFFVVSQITTQQGTLPVLSYFIKKDEKVYVFHGVSSPDGFKGNLPVFQATIRGFEHLLDPEKINVTPDRIQIKLTKKGGAAREVFRKMGVPEDQIEQTALINGMKPEEMVPDATFLKVVKTGRRP